MKQVFASIVVVLTLTSVASAGDNYKMDVKPPAPVKKGAKAATKIHIEGTNGFHVNLEFPVKLTVSPPSGVTVEKQKQTQRDAVKFAKDGADFAIPFVAEETGKKSFTGEFKFAVCTENNCAPTVEKLAFDVEVN
jgi:hypothetical protein